MRIRIALAGLLYAACAQGDQTVTVGPGLSFSPSSVSVAPGEKVTWIWADGPHSSTSDSTSGPEVWDSGVRMTGSFDHVFTTLGSYPYYCSVHSFPGGTAMNGVVEVVAQETPTPTSTLAPTSTSTPTPTSTSTALPTLTATLTPTSPPGSPVPTTTALPASSVPTLGSTARLALALGLAAAALSFLLFSHGR